MEAQLQPLLARAASAPESLPEAPDTAPAAEPLRQHSAFAGLPPLPTVHEEPTPPPAPPPPRRQRYAAVHPQVPRTPHLRSGAMVAPRRHRQPVASDPDQADSVQQGANTAQGENINDASCMRAPNITGEELGTLDGADLSTYRWSIASGGGGDGTILQGDRFSVWVGHNLFSYAHNVVSGDVTFAPDTLTLGLYHDDTSYLGWSSGAFLSLHPHFFSPGASETYRFATGFALSGSGGLRLRAESAVSVLARRAGRTLVQQQQRLVRGPQASVGSGLRLGGLAGRIGVVWDSTSVLRTWQPTATAARLLQRNNALGSSLRESLAALGWRAPPVALPALDAADAHGLQVGDELLLTSARLTTGGIAAACIGLLAGGYHARQTQSALAVRRLDDITLSVVVTHRTTQSSTLGMDIPVIGDLHHSVISAQVLSEGFHIDIREPAGWGAFQNLLSEGHIPEGDHKLDHTSVQPEQLRKLIHDETLPTGVSRALLHWVIMPGSVGRGGGIASPWYVPFCSLAGLNIEHRTHREEHVQVTRQGIAHLLRREMGRRTEVLLGGTQQQAAYVVTESMLPFVAGGQPTLTGAVGVQWETTRFGARTRPWLIDMLNRDLLSDTQLPHFIDPDHPCPYGLTVERPLDADSMARLAGRTPPARAPGIDPADLREVRTQLRHAAGFATRMEVLADFVQALGKAATRGVGALHRAAGGQDRDLRVAVHTPNTDAVLILADEAEVRTVGTALNSGQTRRQRRLDRAAHARALAEARAQLHDVQLDALLLTFSPEKQKQQEAALERAVARIEACAP